MRNVTLYNYVCIIASCIPEKRVRCGSACDRCIGSSLQMNGLLLQHLLMCITALEQYEPSLKEICTKIYLGSVVAELFLENATSVVVALIYWLSSLGSDLKKQSLPTILDSLGLA